MGGYGWVRNVPQKWVIPAQVAGWRLITDKGPGDHRHRTSVTFPCKGACFLLCVLVSQFVDRVLDWRLTIKVPTITGTRHQKLSRRRRYLSKRGSPATAVGVESRYCRTHVIYQFLDLLMVIGMQDALKPCFAEYQRIHIRKSTHEPGSRIRR